VLRKLCIKLTTWHRVMMKMTTCLTQTLQQRQLTVLEQQQQWMLSTWRHAVVASARGHATVAGRAQQQQHRMQEAMPSMLLQRPLPMQKVTRPAQQQA
jgi:hypothetical protein